MFQQKRPTHSGVVLCERPQHLEKSAPSSSSAAKQRTNMVCKQNNKTNTCICTHTYDIYIYIYLCESSDRAGDPECSARIRIYIYICIYIYIHMWVRFVGLLVSVPLPVPRSQLPPRLPWPCYPPPSCLLLLPPSAKPEGGGHDDRGMMEETGQGRIRCHGSLGGSSKSHVPTSRRD